MRSSLALLLALAAVACGGAVDPAQATSEGYAALGRGDAEEALDRFSQALAALDPADTRYRRARMGEIEARVELSPASAAQSFLAYASAQPGQVRAEDYRQVGSRLSARAAHAQAVDVLHAGRVRFPDDPELDAAMKLTQAAVEEQGDSEVLSKLAGLGYASVGK